MHGSSQLWLDDGFDAFNTELTTLANVHWYLGAANPHQGTVLIEGSRGWVELEFENNGLWRTDSYGDSQYYSWYDVRNLQQIR